MSNIFTTKLKYQISEEITRRQRKFLAQLFRVEIGAVTINVGGGYNNYTVNLPRDLSNDETLQLNLLVEIAIKESNLMYSRDIVKLLQG